MRPGGPPGAVPFSGRTDGAAGAGTADPLPQAMVLTAIVITFGVTAFLLALAFRSWLLTGEDSVQDDVEDRRIAAATPGERPYPTTRPEDDACCASWCRCRWCCRCWPPR